MEAERILGLDIHDFDASAADALYEWAGIVIDKLTQNGDATPRLSLANALGLLTEPCWTASVGLPLRGTTPRHRVIARFARERRLSSIWSLNWDAHLENAFEQIGFERDTPTATQPWIVAYKAIITRDDFVFLGRNDLTCIFKPHGCVRALLQAQSLIESGNQQRAVDLSSRLLITKAELTTGREQPIDKIFFAHLTAHLTKSPLLVLGWSISEPYLISVINDSLSDLVQAGTIEELTIVDPVFNSAGHMKASACYKLSKDQVFVGLDIAREFATDELFLWLQARYALDQLIFHAPIGHKAKLIDAATVLTVPTKDSPLLSWSDDFLPAWVRVCWRANLVPCAGYQPHELRLELPDLHIPWNITGLPRPDLAAAALLVCQLMDTAASWDFSMFPGALWRKHDGYLVLPLPTWGEPNELSALLPLLTENSERLGFVSKVDILLLDYDADRPPPDVEKIMSTKEYVAQMMRVPKFAHADSIGHIMQLS